MVQVRFGNGRCCGNVAIGGVLASEHEHGALQAACVTARAALRSGATAAQVFEEAGAQCLLRHDAKLTRVPRRISPPVGRRACLLQESVLLRGDCSNKVRLSVVFVPKKCDSSSFLFQESVILRRA